MIVSSAGKKNKGLRTSDWRKSVGGTPLKDANTKRLGTGPAAEALSAVLSRMASVQQIDEENLSEGSWTD